MASHFCKEVLVYGTSSGALKNGTCFVVLSKGYEKVLSHSAGRGIEAYRRCGIIKVLHWQISFGSKLVSGHHWRHIRTFFSSAHDSCFTTSPVAPSGRSGEIFRCFGQATQATAEATSQTAFTHSMLLLQEDPMSVSQTQTSLEKCVKSIKHSKSFRI